MANAPVQVVLNSDSFIQPVKVKPAPIKTVDFYGDNDQAFLQHKETFISQCNQISEALFENEFSQVGFVKVKLIKKALAKSHRPTQKLFTEKNSCNIIGGDRRGELLIEVTASSIKNLGNLVKDKAEEKTNWKINKEGISEVNSSRWRTELGAIESISLYDCKEKIERTSRDINDWIENERGEIYVSLFKNLISLSELDTLDVETRNLYTTFVEGLRMIEGVQVYRTSINLDNSTLVIRLTDLETNIVSFGPNTNMSQKQISYEHTSKDLSKYKQLLDFLQQHPIVRKIRFSPTFSRLEVTNDSSKDNQIAGIDPPEEDVKYPIVGIIDGGYSTIFHDWTLGEWDYIPQSMRDLRHASFIAGLLVNGKKFNPSICLENDGCQIVDVCILPDLEQDYLGRLYPNGYDDFFRELSLAVEDIATRTGARIFNLSININQYRSAKEYSTFAMLLDSIAIKNDVIFVISAGNISNPRAQWSEDVQNNINELQSRIDDIAYAPAESIRNISVAALNPDNVGLAYYSCKGKGSMTMIKPDLVYPSGFGYEDGLFGEGLFSTNIEGNIISGSGTSYAAPLVAKILASIDKEIQGRVSRETLMALLFHFSEIPLEFQKKIYKPYLRDWIGYGMPKLSNTVLNGNEHSISLVFASRIRPKQIMSFKFSWPPSLISKGKCRGKVKLTLVSTPFVDYNYGDEMIRENVAVSLRSVDENGKKLSQLDPLYKDDVKDIESTSHPYEWQLVESEMKWSPIKVYQKEFKSKKNIGTCSLDVEYESRTADNYSPEGIPFTVILSIEDPLNIAPVYNEMKYAVQVSGAQLADIRTPVTIMQRI